MGCSPRDFSGAELRGIMRIPSVNDVTELMAVDFLLFDPVNAKILLPKLMSKWTELFGEIPKEDLHLDDVDLLLDEWDYLTVYTYDDLLTLLNLHRPSLSGLPHYEAVFKLKSFKQDLAHRIIHHFRLAGAVGFVDGSKRKGKGANAWEFAMWDPEDYTHAQPGQI